MQISVKNFFVLVFLGFNCSVFSQPYEILFDTVSASGWFGGDNITTIGPRSVGVGQSVLVEETIKLETFSFYFEEFRDSEGSLIGRGYDDLILILNIRDSSGSILKTQEAVIIPDTFYGGWVTWSEVDMEISSNTTLIFTCYLAGAFDSNQVTSSHVCDANAGYAKGFRITKQDSTDDGMEEWVEWNEHPWDSNFRLTGTLTLTSVVSDNKPSAKFNLEQNYPNPFNPETNIKFSLPEESKVVINIYNLLGEKITELINTDYNAGTYQVHFNADSELTSGMYFYSIETKNFRDIKKMVLMK